MAIESNIIKIKRSGTSGAPASLKLGELAYSYLTASGNPTSNGGDRLFIGANGVNGVSGNANDVIVIGGKYFTDLLDHERGILTASSALIVDGNKKLDELLVDNLSLNGNTLSTTDTNGNLTLSPNGTGLVSIAGAFTLPRVDGTAGYVLTTNGSGVVSWAAASSSLSIAGTTGTDSVSLISDTLTFAGATTPVSIAVTNNTVTIAVADATTSAKGLASFDTTDFTVTAGAVTVKEERIQDIVGAMVSSNSESNIGITYDDTNGKLDFSVATATSSVLGVASFDSTDFTVTAGAVTVKEERIQDIIGAMVSSNSESNVSITYDDPNGKLDFSVATATSSTLGVATFNTASFTVTSGDVTIKSAGVTNAQLANSTISGVSLGSNLTDLTAGTNLAFDSGTTYNGGTAKTISLSSTLTSVNSVSSSAGTGGVTLNASGGHRYEFKNNGTVTFNGVYTFPATAPGGAGYVLTDAAGNGTLSWAAPASTLNIAGTSGTDGISLLTETLTFAGATTPVSVAVTANTVTIAVADATASTKGLASFNTTGFVVTSGDVALKGNVVQAFTTDSGSLTVSSNAVSILGGEGIDVTHSGTTITVAGEDASTSNKGIASFADANFTVSSGAVTAKSITLGSSTLSLGSTTTSIAGITELTVDNLNINGNTITSTNNDGDIILSPNGTGKVDVSGSIITGLNEPVNPTDAATKYYVDTVAQGLHVHEAAHVATTGTLAALSGGTVTYDNGTDGVGATLTLSSGITAIDGHTLTNGDRILVKNQATQSHNGMYVRTSATVLTRALDFDTAAEIGGGDFTFVEFGTLYGKTGWVQTVEVNTVGSDNVIWEQFSGQGLYIAGDGLTLTGNIFNAVGTADRIAVSTDSIDIASTYAGQTSITTLGTITSGTWSANTIASNKGGTGFTTYAKGDFLYASAANTLSKLTAGTNGQTLQLQDGVPYWGDLDGGTY